MKKPRKRKYLDLFYIEVEGYFEQVEYLDVAFGQWKDNYELDTVFEPQLAAFGGTGDHYLTLHQMLLF